jgi:hypothetical protein
MESLAYEFQLHDFREQDGLIRADNDVITIIAMFLTKHKIPYVIIPEGPFKGIKLTKSDYYRYIKLKDRKK